MTLLLAGSFRVSDYRKQIPDWVKVAVAIRLVSDNGLIVIPEVFARNLEYDHDPALQFRDYDTEKGDFIPPQNDPAHIFAKPKAEHLHKTTGRKPDAERTVTTAGSDLGEAARTRSIRDTLAIHEAKMASKAGDFTAAAQILGAVKRKSRLKPKSRIPSRGFSRQHRPMRRKSA